MIQPTPRDDHARQRSVSTVGAVALLFGLHAAMEAAPLPSFQSSNSMVRSLDPLFVERFAAPPPPDLPRAVSKAPEPSTEASAGVAMDQEVGDALGALSRKFGAELTTTEERSATEAARTGTVPAGTAPTGARGTADADRLGAAADEGRFAELFGGSDALPPPSVRSRPGAESPVARRGALESGTRLRVSDSLAADPTLPVAVTPTSRVEALAERSRRTTPAHEVVVRAYEPERFSAIAVDRLGAWLRANPRELPVGVRVHLRQQPSFPTAAVPLAVEGRSLELFLMYNPSLRELHVVLVEGERSVYLIDRGFQAQSRSLREGTVRRLNGEIVAVNSQAAPAGSDRAREFYNIFLSWWDVARTNVGR